MKPVGIDQVLAQIRASSVSSAGITRPAAPAAQQGPAATEFGDLLKKGIAEVNRSQQSATQSMDAFERGTPGVELGQVMVDMQKASVSFRALTEVRNRFVSAYQEIMNMPI